MFRFVRILTEYEKLKTNVYRWYIALNDFAKDTKSKDIQKIADEILRVYQQLP